MSHTCMQSILSAGDDGLCPCKCVQTRDLRKDRHYGGLYSRRVTAPEQLIPWTPLPLPWQHRLSWRRRRRCAWRRRRPRPRAATAARARGDASRLPGALAAACWPWSERSPPAPCRRVGLPTPGCSPSTLHTRQPPSLPTQCEAPTRPALPATHPPSPPTTPVLLTGFVLLRESRRLVPCADGLLDQASSSTCLLSGSGGRCLLRARRLLRGLKLASLRGHGRHQHSPSASISEQQSGGGCGRGSSGDGNECQNHRQARKGRPAPVPLAGAADPQLASIFPAPRTVRLRHGQHGASSKEQAPMREATATGGRTSRAEVELQIIDLLLCFAKLRDCDASAATPAPQRRWVRSDCRECAPTSHHGH
eukprot:COSAG01_NODE_3854_length_5625_cov_2.597431_2_plen_364_part_00